MGHIEESKKYINAKIEPEKSLWEEDADELRKDIKELLEEFNSPLVEIDFSLGKNVEAENDEIKSSLAFESVEDYLKANPSQERRLGEINREISFWKIMKKLEYFNKRTGEKLDVMKLLPSDYLLIFREDLKGERRQGSDFINKYCLISGDPSRPSVILGILHEIGHCDERENIKDDYARRMYGYDNSVLSANIGNPFFKMSARSLKDILKSERNAWSFVLKNVKPLLGLGPMDKESVDKYIHEFALTTYSNEIREKMP